MSTPVAFAEPVKERTVEVVAPSNLDGGYEFFVNAGNNVSYKVRVPNGGVTAGQRFQAIVLSEGTAAGAHNIPSGRWRDGLCDCCAFGCCHPVFCLAFWCNACAVGQVLHRMKLNICSSPSPNGQYPSVSAFKIFFGLVILSYVLSTVVNLLTAEDTTTTTTTTDNGASAETSSSGGLGGLVNGALAIFVFIITMMLRSHVRNKYGIPGGCCGDCCCSFWCGPCVTCQISRHTADFRNHPAGCCTDNGLGQGVPDVV